jgi:hypothetical protein
MDLKDFVGTKIFIIANGITYEGVLESDSSEVVRLIGNMDNEEVLIIIPKLTIDSIIIPTGKSHE